MMIVAISKRSNILTSPLLLTFVLLYAQELVAQELPQQQLSAPRLSTPLSSAQQSIIQQPNIEAETSKQTESRNAFLPKSLFSFPFFKQQSPALLQSSTQKNIAEQNSRSNIPQANPSAKYFPRPIPDAVPLKPSYVSSGMTPNERLRTLGVNSPRRLNSSPSLLSNTQTQTNQNLESKIQNAAGRLPNRNALVTQYAFRDVAPPIIAGANHETNEVVGVGGLIPKLEKTPDDEASLPEYKPIPLRKFNEKSNEKSIETPKQNTPENAESESGEKENELANNEALALETKENREVISPGIVNSNEFSLASATQDEKEHRAITTARSVSRQNDHDHEQHSHAPKPRPDNLSEEELLHEINATSMQSAAFNGIIPGTSAKSELFEAMGEPVKITPNGEYEVWQYAIEGLAAIDVTLKQEKVFSLMLGFSEPYPAEQIRDQLKEELRGIRSILIPDDNNNILGQLFPEKGVVFEFTPSEKPGEPSLMVTNVAIEPITAIPFVIRGERYLTISNSKAKWDLTIAVQLDRNNHRARWLLAKAFLADGQLAEAQREAIFAVKLNDQDLQYHVTLAEIIGKSGHTKEARQYLDEILPYCDNAPQVKGLAECLMGDFYRDDVELQDCGTGSKYHTKAIKTLEPLVTSQNLTLRQQAKMIVLRAYLSSVMDISWGNWDGKEKVLKDWLDGAKEIAMDLVIKEKMSRECLLNVATTAISAYMGRPESDDFLPYISEAESVAEEIIGQNADDKGLTQKIEKELGLSYSNVEQIYEARKNYKQAMKYGQKAIEYLERGIRNRNDVIELYRLANIYYQMGRIQATGLSNDSGAIRWFTKAIPLFQQVESRLDDYEQPRLGEIYASIGVSYWNVDEKEYALKISEYGIDKLERAVEQKLIPEKILAVPYENLSAMYEKIGRKEEAENYYIRSKSVSRGGTGSSIR
ncbi:MAG: hypothetical protein LBT05_15025 [Planctomycetaceae bacterium]|jgi:tetratricopeptide (TPR) repeat protein|nr:hypothetical protein [Planctomycetaceae bacterium]